MHVLVWGPVPFLGEGLPTTELLKAVRASKGVAVLAHPSRREAWRVFDTAWTDYLLGIEVWNRKTDGWAPSSTAPPLLEDTALVPFVGMDFHDRNQMFPLSMEMDISPMVSEESVLDCESGPPPRVSRSFPASGEKARGLQKHRTGVYACPVRAARAQIKRHKELAPLFADSD